MTDAPRKVAVYVDGFNLYHALKNLGEPHLRWLNLRSLAEKFTDRKTETIAKIYYFSAIATHMDKGIITRHEAYIEALSCFDVDFVPGHFKQKIIRYQGNNILRHEEKETDVNVAIHIVRDAMKRAYDRILVITNDTDIIPAIRMARQENPALRVKIITPPGYKPHFTLRGAAEQKNPTIISVAHIRMSLLPDNLTLPSGKTVTIPDKFRKPA